MPNDGETLYDEPDEVPGVRPLRARDAVLVMIVLCLMLWGTIIHFAFG